MRIKVIAPSGKPIEGAEFLYNAKEKLAAENIELDFSEDIFSDSNLPFFAAEKEVRLHDFHEALLSEEYQIIWPARGGYGAAEIAYASLGLKIKTPKILIGFSDITALHILFNQHFNIPTIHADVISNFIKKESNFKEYFSEILLGKTISYKLKKLNDVDFPKAMNSSVTGGNLAVLESMIGTELSPQFRGKIVVLEDVNEPGYKIHRTLLHFKHAKILDGAVAIIFGEFSSGDEYVSDAIGEFASKEVRIPCFKIENIGHGACNDPIIFGSNAKISDNILTVESPFAINI